MPNATGPVKSGIIANLVYIEAMKQIFALALLLPSFGFAQDAPSRNAQLYHPQPGVEYYCTDRDGDRIELGQVVCITASCTTWMARCEIAGNNNLAMWRKLQDGCPAVSLVDRLKSAG